MKTIATKSTTRKKRNSIFGVFRGQIVELVPDPFNTGYEEMKTRKEREAKARKQMQTK